MNKKRKRVCFVCYGLGIGGIEKCLVNLINNMSEELYTIDLLLMNPELDLRNDIKRKINYIDWFQYVLNTTDVVPEIKYRGGVIKNWKSFLRYCLFRAINKMGMDSWKLFRKLPGNYDIAIAYSQNDFSPYYVIDKVMARRKVLWYHNGAYEGIGKKKQRDMKYYPQFDYVVAVSSDCKSVLEKKFDFSENQLIVLRNICDVGEIIRKSEEFVPYETKDDCIIIATVGRMTREKGANLVLDACEYLKNKNVKCRWHWIGDGNCREQVVQEIKKRGLQKYFILEGKQVNPYPFMKCADIYVQPSYYEAYSTTVTEAKILKRPIIATDVGGMRDQICDGTNGMLVKIDAVEIAKAIESLCYNREIREKYSSILREETLVTENIMSTYEKTVFGEVY